MALLYSEQLKEELGQPAHPFELKGTDGNLYSLESFSEAKALVVVFMCNHCPYVIAVEDRINELAKEYASKGVRLVGINPNDGERYPEDSFEKMIERVKSKGYEFPYLHDETQEVAKRYGAVCTPDPYVYENVGGEFLLRYHGRIDDNWKEPTQIKQRELASSLDAILSGNEVDEKQNPSMGCSIKWKF